MLPEPRKYLLQYEDDIPYTTSGIPEQSLDIIRLAHPDGQGRPLIIYLHDGAWQKGDKTDGNEDLAAFVRSGNYVAASINYRLTNNAAWPAQLHDCKAAIRWLRAHAQQYGIDSERIAVWGKSAGAYLALMLGATATNPAFKGIVGQHHNFSAKISAVVNCAGIVDFNSLPAQPSSVDHTTADSPEGRLLGGALSKFIYAAKDASPRQYINSKMPPVLSIHSENDDIIPYAQSEQLHQQLQACGVPNILIPVHKAKHGEYPKEMLLRIEAFLNRELLQQDIDIPTDPLTIAP